MQSFRNSWTLSDVTKAKWMNGGNIRLDRRKFDILGRSKGSGYKVYVKPTTYLAILEKSGEIDKTMKELAEKENPQPVNIQLCGNSILQLSFFQKDPTVPELYPYYGIHMVDDEDQIIAGAGMNLTQMEYLNFLAMLMKWKGVGESMEVGGDSGTLSTQVNIEKKPISAQSSYHQTKVGSYFKPNPQGMKGVKRHLSLLDCSISEQVKQKKTQCEGAVKKEHVNKNSPTPLKRVLVTMHGWEWYIPKDDVTPELYGRSQGGWFINPTYCIQEAMRSKPPSEAYRLNSVIRKKYLDIDDDMVDAALAKLVKDNYDNIIKEKKEDLADGDACDGDINYGKYASEILGNISMVDVFDLCVKVVGYYHSINEFDVNWLMKLILAYEKNEGIFYLIRENHLNKYCVQLFDYLSKK